MQDQENFFGIVLQFMDCPPGGMEFYFNVIVPLLTSSYGFSFILGHGVSIFGGFQHPPVNGHSIASCEFGVLIGEDECMSFYSNLDCSIKMAFESQWDLIVELPQDWEKQKLFKGINKTCDNLGGIRGEWEVDSRRRGLCMPMADSC